MGNHHPRCHGKKTAVNGIELTDGKKEEPLQLCPKPLLEQKIETHWRSSEPACMLRQALGSIRSTRVSFQDVWQASAGTRVISTWQFRSRKRRSFQPETASGYVLAYIILASVCKCHGFLEQNSSTNSSLTRKWCPWSSFSRATCTSQAPFSLPVRSSHCTQCFTTQPPETPAAQGRPQHLSSGVASWTHYHQQHP